MVIPKVGRFYGRPFRTQRGMTQRELVSQKSFNIVVGTVLRAVLLGVCGASRGATWVGMGRRRKKVLYADESYILRPNRIWV